MQGITGVISTHFGDELEPLVCRMAQSMVKEKGGGMDTIVDKRLGAGVGWLRQADDRNETVPFWNQARDLCVLTYGEPFPDTGEIVDGEGSNPAAYLLRGYENEGAKVLESLNGWFCGVLMDLRQDKIILFNDRYGLGRLYIHQNASGFYFASQAKALLNILSGLRRIDSKALAEWFTCGCVLKDKTLFRDMFLLPAGSAWTFQNGGVEKRNYFRAQVWEDQNKLDVEGYYLQLRETFARVLPRYFRGGQRVGMSLTAGLDGRMIMAWSSKAPGELPCYTFNSQYRDCADAQIGRRVARQCCQPHDIVSVGEEFIASFPTLAEKAVYLTDGAMDVTGAAELYVNRKAREIAPIRLTGNYGSEILRSNIAFRPQQDVNDLLDGSFLPEAQEAVRTYAGELHGNRRSFIAFKQVPWHHFGRFAVEQSQLTVRSPFLDNDLVSLAFQAPASMETSAEPCLRLIRDGNSQLARIPTDRGIVYPATRLANRLRGSIENFLAKAEYAYDYGMPQWLARVDHALAPLKPERLFLGRQKFCHFRVWYRDRLASYVKEILLDRQSLSRPYLNGRRVEEVVSQHLAGTHNFTSQIHKLLSIELVHRSLLGQR